MFYSLNDVYFWQVNIMKCNVAYTGTIDKNKLYSN
jgi:hypothetical protein